MIEGTIIAQRGTLDYLLIKTREADGLEYGRVWVNTKREPYIGPEMLVQGILKFGYWEPFTGDQALLAKTEGLPVHDMPRRVRSGDQVEAPVQA